MTATRTLRRTGLTLALGLALAACAQQNPAQQPQAGVGAGATAQGMPGHDMSSMNMQQMAAHCTELRQQMRSGAALSPDMRAMMAQCDQMPGQPVAPGTAPASGLPRR